jgi:hypothetical protein
MIGLGESERLEKKQTCESSGPAGAPKKQCSKTKSDHRIQLRFIDRPQSRRRCAAPTLVYHNAPENENVII